MLPRALSFARTETTFRAITQPRICCRGRHIVLNANFMSLLLKLRMLLMLLPHRHKCLAVSTIALTSAASSPIRRTMLFPSILFQNNRFAPAFRAVVDRLVEIEALDLSRSVSMRSRNGTSSRCATMAACPTGVTAPAPSGVCTRAQGGRRQRRFRSGAQQTKRDWEYARKHRRLRGIGASEMGNEKWCGK